MREMVLETPGMPLVPKRMMDPHVRPGDVLVRVEACAVCRTDLHMVDGGLTDLAIPITPEHEIAGTVIAVEDGVDTLGPGMRVGVPGFGGTCGTCAYGESGRENPCDHPEFTGYTRPGEFTGHAAARADFCIRLRDDADAVATAPRLYAGPIDWRSLRQAGDALRLGLWGFDAAVHIMARVAIRQGCEALKREDARTFLASKATQGLRTTTRTYLLERARLMRPVRICAQAGSAAWSCWHRGPRPCS